MSSSVLKRVRGERRSEAVGLEASRAYFSARTEAGAGGDQGEWTEVHIQWKPILQEVAAILGGVELIYNSEYTGNGMYQQRVNFTLPLEICGSEHRTVSVAGNKCYSLCEAQSEASAAALQWFSAGFFNSKVLDISSLRCEEMKIKCEDAVGKSGHFQRFFEMLLADWADCTRQIEDIYGPLSRQIVQDVYHTSDDMVRNARIEVGRRLFSVRTISQVKHSLVDSKAIAAKSRRWDVRASMGNYFSKGLVPRVERHQRKFPHEIKISMRAVLREMMISLGWDEPKFTMTRHVSNSHGCEVEIQPKGNVGRILVQGGEEVLEVEAGESAAKAAILYLENVMSIFLIDVNYNQRSHAEACVAEGENLLDITSSLAVGILAEWEGEVEDVSICDDHCQNMLAEHVAKDPCNAEYNVKWEYAETIAKLYKVCLLDLRLGRHRYKSFMKWTKQ